MGCSRFNNLPSATLCLKSVMSTTTPFAVLLVGRLNRMAIAERIRRHGDPYEASRLLHSVFWIDKACAGDLFAETTDVLFSAHDAPVDAGRLRYTMAVADLLQRQRSAVVLRQGAARSPDSPG